MSRIRTNILANYIGRGWNALSVYLFVPIYLYFLGVEAYGLVGFYVALLGVLMVADLGLTATLSRELARLSAEPGSAPQMRHLVRSIELIYIAISVLIMLLVLALAEPIALYWLKPQNMPLETVERAVRMMGISIALHLPARIYLGGLMGLERQVLANAINVAVGVIRNAGAALVLWLVAPTSDAYFLWQVLSSALMLVMFRQALWHAMPKDPTRPQWSLPVLRSVMGYSIDMALISFTTLVIVQVDKLIISKLLPLEQLGYYSLANALSQAPTVLSVPIAVAVFPRLTQLIASGDESPLASVYHRSNRLLAALVFPVGIVMTLFSREVIALWTQNPDAAREAHLVASLLLIGSLALALQSMPLQLAFAAGWTRPLVYIGTGGILIGIPLYYFTIRAYGLVGGGVTWIVLNSSATLVFLLLLHRRVLRGHAFRLFTFDFAPYLAAALAAPVLLRLLVPTATGNLQMVLLLAAALAGSCALTALLFILTTHPKFAAHRRIFSY